MKKLIIFVVVLLVGISAAFVIGARVGVSEFLYADAHYKASILATQLRALRAGKPDAIIASMEISLNAELANHGKSMESHFTWFWSDLKSKDDRPARNAVTYRMANPYEGPDHSKPENGNPGTDMDSQFVKDKIVGQKILNHYLQKVLKHYGDMAHDSSLQPTQKAGAAERGRSTAEALRGNM